MRICRTLAAPLLAALTLAAAAPGAVQAAVRPTPGLADPRVRTVPYDPDQVVELTATLGYQLMIEFDAGERIENVSIGDSLSWQITPNRKANLLFLKALGPRARTNMAVVTNLRRYAFALAARPAGKSDRDIVFGLRFDYPAPEAVAVLPTPPPQPPQDVNHAYTYAGSGKNLPTRVFDDGRATYFAFAEGADLPAVFALAPDGRESVTDAAVRDGFLVVDQLAPRFVLRGAGETTVITNEGYRPPAGGTLQPTSPRRKARR